MNIKVSNFKANFENQEDHSSDVEENVPDNDEISNEGSNVRITHGSWGFHNSEEESTKSDNKRANFVT